MKQNEMKRDKRLRLQKPAGASALEQAPSHSVAVLEQLAVERAMAESLLAGPERDYLLAEAARREKLSDQELERENLLERESARRLQLGPDA